MGKINLAAKSIFKFKYVNEIIVVNSLQTIVISFLLGGDLLLSIGGKCLYYNSVGYQILYTFPLILNIYFLIKTFNEEIEISRIYKLSRYQNFGKWNFNYLTKSVCTHLVCFFFSYIISVFVSMAFGYTLKITEYIGLGFFYVMSYTLCFVCISLIYLLLKLNKDNDSLNVLLLLFCLILIILSPVVNAIENVYSFFLIFPITHFGIFEKPTDYVFSLLIGLAYMVILYCISLVETKKIDILK